MWQCFGILDPVVKYICTARSSYNGIFHIELNCADVAFVVSCGKVSALYLMHQILHYLCLYYQTIAKDHRPYLSCCCI